MDYDTWKRWNAKVARGNLGDCWLWTASTGRDGYGWFRDGKVTTAHRWSYAYYNGPIPDDMTVDHICRVRRCVNPDHLRLLTLVENVLAGEGFGAVNARKTRCVHGHPFSPENTHVDARGGRQCRACARERYATARRAVRGS